LSKLPAIPSLSVSDIIHVVIAHEFRPAGLRYSSVLRMLPEHSRRGHSSARSPLCLLARPDDAVHPQHITHWQRLFLLLAIDRSQLVTCRCAA
jgi:hypothetical protein